MRNADKLASSASASTDRRTHARLRDLCDEVLASFRLASRGDQFSEQDRAEARALMTRVAGSRA